MELLTSKREQNGKNDNKRLRRQRQIPAVVYGQGEAQSISIALNDFEAFLRKIPKGELSTARFSLAVDKEKVEVLVKDVQYAKTSYDILHLDFLKLDKKQLVTVNVPVRFTGQMACPGLKLGGVLRPVMRTVKIRCLPDQIPSHFEIDVSQLSLKQSKRVKDIQFSKDIRVVSKMDEVVGLIGKR
ncbi:MAG: 50S ribosomal protein L25 [Chlamydiae bacterium]|nr:50S ribosomal protein L25 [Chlamydiota bacterium]